MSLMRDVADVAGEGVGVARVCFAAARGNAIAPENKKSNISVSSCSLISSVQRAEWAISRRKKQMNDHLPACNTCRARKQPTV
jgi:hypothetical protein